jgi:hypothetical protein
MTVGGSAYLIPGTLNPELWKDLTQPTTPPPPKPFWQRIFGAASSKNLANVPTITNLSNGDRLVDIPAAPLPGRLIPDLLSWVRSKLTPPSRASQIALEYMNIITPTLYVRGSQRRGEDEPAFWIQIAFPGCAGEAKTSARLASHWTARWYRTEHERITSEHFIPFGFHAIANDATQDDPLYFLPAGALGYLEYIPADLPASPPRVEIDHAVTESQRDNEIISRLHTLVVDHMTDLRCRCQLCEPGYPDIMILSHD